MRANRPDLLWRGGGLAGVVILSLVGWFVFIGPAYEEGGQIGQEATTSEEKVGTLQRRLVELRQQDADLQTYLDRLAANRQALPTVSAMAAFLRQLQTSAAQTQVTVVGLIVGAASDTIAAGTAVKSLPLTLTVDGDTAQLIAFVEWLQRNGPRAVLIYSASAVPKDQTGSFAGIVTLTLTMRAFVA